MVSKKFKVLEVVDNNEYIFNSFALKAGIQQFRMEMKAKGKSYTKEMVVGDLADAIHVSCDSVKNWMYAKNGPGNLETVKAMAGYLQMNYRDLLKEHGRKNMENNKEINQNAVMNTHNTKDVIRTIYQKMACFMDAAVEELCFDSCENVFYTYEIVYKDIISTLHRNMLDIPIDIYDQLLTVAESDLHLYMYGIPEGPADVWDLCEYVDRYGDENIYDVRCQTEFMKEKADEFYARMREILKDYLIK